VGLVFDIKGQESKIHQPIDMTQKYFEIALKWAPVNYQYIRISEGNNHYQTKKDLPCPINFECYGKDAQGQCWNTKESRQRLEKVRIEDLVPVCYYAVSETESHYFVMYAFYHADDDTHINDMEGCLVILEKHEDGEELLGMITVAHMDFWKYTYNDRLLSATGGQFRDDEHLETDDELDSANPLIQQEEGKHGLYALGTRIHFGTKIIRWFLALLNRQPDVIVLYPGKKALPYTIERIRRGKKTPYNPSFYYELVDVFDKTDGFFERWEKRPNETFAADGKFHGGAANPPWLWNPGLEFKKNTEEGLLWHDPAKIAAKSFRPADGRKPFSTKYIRQLPMPK
jgi:hypothetical protein